MSTNYLPGSTARFFQQNPMAAIDLLETAKAAVAYFPNPVHPARMQLQAAIDLVELRHLPKRVGVPS